MAWKAVLDTAEGAPEGIESGHSRRGEVALRGFGAGVRFGWLEGFGGVGGVWGLGGWRGLGGGWGGVGGWGVGGRGGGWDGWFWVGLGCFFLLLLDPQKKETRRVALFPTLEKMGTLWKRRGGKFSL